MFLAVAAVATALLLLASAYDLRTREIPDWISAGMGVVAIASSASGWLGISLLWVAVGGLVGLVIAWLLFTFGKLGGGDAKLIMALSMLVGPVGILIVLFWMAVAGGVLSLVAIIRDQRDYAYVPAITAGFIGYLSFVQFVV